MLTSLPPRAPNAGGFIGSYTSSPVVGGRGGGGDLTATVAPQNTNSNSNSPKFDNFSFNNNTQNNNNFGQQTVAAPTSGPSAASPYGGLDSTPTHIRQDSKGIFKYGIGGQQQQQQQTTQRAAGSSSAATLSTTSASSSPVFPNKNSLGGTGAGGGTTGSSASHGGNTMFNFDMTPPGRASYAGGMGENSSLARTGGGGTTAGRGSIGSVGGGGGQFSDNSRQYIDQSRDLRSASPTTEQQNNNKYGNTNNNSIGNSNPYTISAASQYNNPTAGTSAASVASGFPSPSNNPSIVLHNGSMAGPGFNQQGSGGGDFNTQQQQQQHLAGGGNMIPSPVEPANSASSPGAPGGLQGLLGGVGGGKHSRTSTFIDNERWSTLLTDNNNQFAENMQNNHAATNGQQQQQQQQQHNRGLSIGGGVPPNGSPSSINKGAVIWGSPNSRRSQGSDASSMKHPSGMGNMAGTGGVGGETMQGQGSGAFPNISASLAGGPNSLVASPNVTGNLRPAGAMSGGLVNSRTNSRGGNTGHRRTLTTDSYISEAGGPGSVMDGPQGQAGGGHKRTKSGKKKVRRSKSQRLSDGEQQHLLGGSQDFEHNSVMLDYMEPGSAPPPQTRSRRNSGVGAGPMSNDSMARAQSRVSNRTPVPEGGAGNMSMAGLEKKNSKQTQQIKDQKVQISEMESKLRTLEDMLDEEKAYSDKQTDKVEKLRGQLDEMIQIQEDNEDEVVLEAKLCRRGEEIIRLRDNLMRVHQRLFTLTGGVDTDLLETVGAAGEDENEAPPHVGGLPYNRIGFKIDDPIVLQHGYLDVLEPGPEPRFIGRRKWKRRYVVADDRGVMCFPSLEAWRRHSHAQIRESILYRMCEWFVPRFTYPSGDEKRPRHETHHPYATNEKKFYFGFVAKQPNGDVNNARVELSSKDLPPEPKNQMFVLRTISNQEHLDWTHFFARHFNTEEYKNMFPMMFPFDEAEDERFDRLAQPKPKSIKKLEFSDSDDDFHRRSGSESDDESGGGKSGKKKKKNSRRPAMFDAKIQVALDDIEKDLEDLAVQTDPIHISDPGQCRDGPLGPAISIAPDEAVDPLAASPTQPSWGQGDDNDGHPHQHQHQRVQSTSVGAVSGASPGPAAGLLDQSMVAGNVHKAALDAAQQHANVLEEELQLARHDVELEKETSNRLRATATAVQDENERLTHELENLQQNLTHLVHEQQLLKQIDATRQEQIDKQKAETDALSQLNTLRSEGGGAAPSPIGKYGEGEGTAEQQEGVDDGGGDEKMKRASSDQRFTAFLEELVGCVQREMSKPNSPKNGPPGTGGSRSRSTGSNSSSFGYSDESDYSTSAESSDYDDDYDGGYSRRRRRRREGSGKRVTSLEEVLSGDKNRRSRRRRHHHDEDEDEEEFECNTCNDIFSELKRVVSERDGLLRELSRRHLEYQDNMKTLALKAVNDLDHLYAGSKQHHQQNDDSDGDFPSKPPSHGSLGHGMQLQESNNNNGRTSLPPGEALPVVMLQLQRVPAGGDHQHGGEDEGSPSKIDFHASCAIDTEAVEVIKKTEEERMGPTNNNNNSNNNNNVKTTPLQRRQQEQQKGAEANNAVGPAGATTRWWFHDKATDSVVTVVVDISRNSGVAALGGLDFNPTANDLLLRNSSSNGNRKGLKGTHTHELLSSSSAAGGVRRGRSAAQQQKFGRGFSPSPMGGAQKNNGMASNGEFLLSTLPSSGTKSIPRAGSFSNGLHGGGVFGGGATATQLRRASSNTPTRRLMSIPSSGATSSSKSQNKPKVDGKPYPLPSPM